VLVVCGFGASANAVVTVLTFDDVTGANIDLIPDGYGGLNWDNMAVLDAPVLHPGSGYENGLVSGDYVAFNNAELVATVTESPFNFIGAYLTAINHFCTIS